MMSLIERKAAAFDKLEKLVTSHDLISLSCEVSNEDDGGNFTPSHFAIRFGRSVDMKEEFLDLIESLPVGGSYE